MLGALTSMQHRQSRSAARLGRGLTLVELMVSLAIVAVLAAIAVPALRDYVARKRVEGTAQELVTDLRWLRTLRIQRNETVGIRFGGNSSSTCYVIYALGGESGVCDCTRSTGVCPSDMPELKTVQLPRSNGVSVSATPGGLAVSRYNLPIGGTTLRVTVASPNGGSVLVTTNAALMPDLCSVSGPESTLKPCPAP